MQFCVNLNVLISWMQKHVINTKNPQKFVLKICYKAPTGTILN